MAIKTGISVIGTGIYLPKKIATNEDFAKIVDTSDEWITSRTGIKTRHIATDETTWQMGANAAKNALLDAGISPNSINAVLVTSVTSDYITPSIACLIARELSINNATCFDMNVACAGFTYALDLARRYLMDEDCENVLVVSTEMMTKITDYEDRATCVLFGDGAGACVVSKSDKRFYGLFGSEPAGAAHLVARSFKTDNPFMETQFDPLSDEITPTNGHYLYQNGKEVYKFATHIMSDTINKICEKAGIVPSELALIVPHQANLRIISSAASKLDLSLDHFFINIEKYGNMSSACIPIGLHEAIKSGRIKRGDLICIIGFGAGLVYGSCLFEY